MSATAADPARLSPATDLGTVALTVSDLGRARDFYETVIGLSATVTDDGDVTLGPAGGPTLVRLHGEPAASARDPRAPGLFHLAILVPSRRDLGQALLRTAQAGWRLSGASDHLVSEALYLNDPEGNGIELYRDRPRTDWPRDQTGELMMDTRRLDLQDLLAQATPGSDPLASAADEVMAPDTRIGHVHLQVADIPRAQAFYVAALGFAPTVRSYSGALFVAAGGYHHHVGLNTWNSAGASPPARDAAGLRSFEIVLADRDELERTLARLRDAGATAEPDPAAGDGSVSVRDPFGSAIALRAA